MVKRVFRQRLLLLLLYGLTLMTDYDSVDSQQERVSLSAMYGKHFGSMYSGSMVGAGALAFAVMGYCIANAAPDRKVGSQVELNPVLLAAIFGEKQADIEKVIKMLCSPDPQSRTKEKEGRRLVQLGQFDYQLVNGAKYRAIRDEETRRESNRIAQTLSRARKRGLPLAGEVEFVAALKKGDDLEADRILDRYSPKS